MKKKFFSCLAAILLCVTTFSFPASAATYTIDFELNCSAVDNVKSGVWGRTDKLKVSEAVYENNYYYSCPNLWGGIYSDNHANVATEADPQFKDATNGDFTVQNQTLIDAQVGDPRWLQ